MKYLCPTGASSPVLKEMQCLKNNLLTENGSDEAQFVVVLEAAGLSEIDLGEYCRCKGLCPEQIKV